MLAVVKERGLLTHKLMFNDTPSLDQLVTGYFAPNPFTFRAVNRRDKDTSGLLLIAKDEFSASLLGEKIKNGEILKTYLAVVVGKPENDSFIIEKPILKVDGTVKRVIDSSGKYAKTECRFVKDLGGGLSLVSVTLYTGRTHQIRVHLSSVGLPLYADSLYGKEVKGKTYILHAKGLKFIHPFTKEIINLDIGNDYEIS
jgi:23S rRNA pseudouridine1911/1915/1917 synthase